MAGVKFYAILQLTRGYSTRKLGDYCRVTHKQICNWADRFDREGIEGLGMRHGRGRHSFITDRQKEQEKKALLQSPEAFGYNTANWSGPLQQKHLENACRTVYSQAAVQVLLHEPGFSFQRSRGKYPERDEARRETAKTDMKKH